MPIIPFDATKGLIRVPAVATSIDGRSFDLQFDP